MNNIDPGTKVRFRDYDDEEWLYGILVDIYYGEEFPYYIQENKENHPYQYKECEVFDWGNE
jgi:hypothetical protein